jgi:hypothetical protein
MQTVTNNLINHNLITESEREQVIKILTEVDDTSNFVILRALAKIEITKIVGKEHMNDNPDSLIRMVMMTTGNLNGQTQNAIKEDLIDYLSRMKSAGLVSSDLYDEIRPNIDKGMYPGRFFMIGHISHETPYPGSAMPNIDVTERQKTNLTKEQIENAIAGWERIGILKHLNNDQISLAKQKAIEIKTDNLNDVLLNFPAVIHSFDTELENLRDPYAELLKEFSKISHGVFKPSNIVDNFDPSKDKATVTFTLNNKHYSKDLQVSGDWIDPDFIYFIIQTVAENKLPGQFYNLYEGGQGAYFIFLTPLQYKSLTSSQLLVFGEDHR